MEPIEYLKVLEKNGFESYIVGGYVRDKILGIDSLDIDIITNAKPDEIAKIFDINDNSNVGCISIKDGDYEMDITTFRRESSYFGHKPKKVKYITDLKTDLKRRDFTINTICMNSNGEYIDLLGGIKDLNNKLLKVVGNTKNKLYQDPLRLYRALRFAIVYDLKLDDKIFTFMLNNRRLFNEVSYRRRLSELEFILKSNNALKGLEFLKNVDLLKIFNIDYNNIVITSNIYGIYAQLDGIDVYPFTKKQKEKINEIREIINSKVIDEKILYNYNIDNVLISGEILNIKKSTIMSIYNKMNIHNNELLNISGNTIMNLLNIKDGKKIKEIKNDLIEQLLSGNLNNSENELQEYIIKKWK